MFCLLFNHKLWRVVICSLFFGLFFSLNCCPVSNNSAQAARNRFDDSQVRAVFLFNLTNFVFWPENSFSTQNSPFIITILGSNPFGNNLQNIVHNEKVGSHPIIIKQVKALGQLEKTHILYIHRDLKKNLATIIEQTAQPGVLTVSAYPGFAESGGAVNLLIRKKRLILELNIAAAERNGLKFSSKLLQLAKVFGIKQ